MSHFNFLAMVVSVLAMLCQPTLAQSSLNSELRLEPSTPEASEPSLAPQAPPAFQCPESLNPSNYLLGSGDTLGIVVIGYEEFKSEQIVLPDGTISVPLLGSVNTAGHTSDSLAKLLSESLKKYLVNPCVTVSLLNLRPVMVNVMGEVNHPGPVQFKDSTNASLPEALLAAGGVSNDADVRRVVVQRFVPQTEELTSIEVNLWDAISASNTVAKPFLLRDGDSILIPRLVDDQLNPRLLASSSLAPAEIRVNFVGEVNKPGEAQVPANSSISEAIASAGGTTDDARLGNVTLLRFNREGPPEEQKFDLSHLKTSYLVQDGDIIIVSKRALPRILDSVGNLVSRIINPFNSLLFFNRFFPSTNN
jgi:polysaccharide export outer membrane protein